MQIDRICHSCLIGAGAGTHTYLENGGPLTPNPRLYCRCKERRGGHTCPALSHHLAVLRIPIQMDWEPRRRNHLSVLCSRAQARMGCNGGKVPVIPFNSDFRWSSYASGWHLFCAKNRIWSHQNKDPWIHFDWEAPSLHRGPLLLAENVHLVHAIILWLYGEVHMEEAVEDLSYRTYVKNNKPDTT